MPYIGKRYLVHIRLGAAQPAKARIAQAAAGVKEVLNSLMAGTNNLQLAYTSHDGATFGFFLKTMSSAKVVRAELECPGANKPSKHHIPPPLMGEDAILVLEIGEDFDERGLSKPRTWLQHR